MNAFPDFVTPWIQWQRAVVNESFAAVGKMAQLPHLAEKARQIRKGVTPSETVYEEDRLKLKH